VFGEVHLGLLTCVEISSAGQERKSDVRHAQFIIQVGSLHTAQSQIVSASIVIVIFFTLTFCGSE
jgi:hypothetical protein